MRPVILALALAAGCRTAPLAEPVRENLPDLALPPVEVPPDLAIARGEPDLSCQLNACGECGPVRAEECNGFDDDCDGEVDEGCPRKVAELPGSDELRVRVSGDRVAFDSYVNNSASTVMALELPSADAAKLGAGMGVALDGDLAAWYTQLGSWGSWS